MVFQQLRQWGRSLRMHRGYTVIHLAGLGVALGTAFLIVLFIHHEWSYDRHWEQPQRLFRLSTHLHRNGGLVGSALTPAALAPTVEQAVPGIQKAVRLFSYSWRETVLLSAGDASHYEQRFFLADQHFFDVFQAAFLHGSARLALKNRHSAVLTRSAAQRYFGDDPPLGKRIRVENFGPIDLIVTAVVEDQPATAHFHYDIVVPMAAGKEMYWPTLGEGWQNRSFYTYVKLEKQASSTDVAQSINRVLKASAGQQDLSVRLQPVTDIHLHSHFRDEIEPNGSALTVWLFSGLMLILLSVAGMNYVNLATARVLARAREVGVRKSVGALRGQLVSQFLTESIGTALLALPLALFLAGLALPVFSDLLNRHFSLQQLLAPKVLGTGLGLVVLLGGLAGVYPALRLSSFDPARVLKGSGPQSASRSHLRRLLVLFQSTVAIGFVFTALVAARQIRFFQKRPLGFSREQVLIVPFKDDAARHRLPLLRQALADQSHVRAITACSQLPSYVRCAHEIVYEGADVHRPPQMQLLSVDVDFFKTFGMTLTEGRAFHSNIPTDQSQAYILNQSAMKMLGWQTCAGQSFMLSNRRLARATFTPGVVIGVVEDFHFRSFHERITPLVLRLAGEDCRYLAVRLGPDDMATGVSEVKRIWEAVLPDRPFEYFFFDDHYNRLYQSELRLGRALTAAALISVFIALLGLLGLSAHSTARRSKEIGVRKILGASAWQLVLMLAGEVLWLHLAGAALALPLAFWACHHWLEQFVYRISIGWQLPLGTAALTGLAALMAVAYHVIRATVASPVSALSAE